MTYMIRLSVIVITYNEEKNLARCLESVAGIADELVVVDSASTDSTPAIARSYNARFIDHPFEGYARQKMFATAQATNDWVLSLDADEELTPALKAAILAVKNQPTCDVYRMPRLTNYCGKWIKHCGWYPDYQTRLYNRTRGEWQDLKVHEYWKPAADARVGMLAADLLHYSFDTIGSHLNKINKYTELAAQAAAARGKTAGIAKIIFSPLWHFISEYFFRLGFLDGFYGFVICRLSAYSAFLKYTRIREYSRRQR